MKSPDIPDIIRGRQATSPINYSLLLKLNRVDERAFIH